MLLFITTDINNKLKEGKINYYIIIINYYYK